MMKKSQKIEFQYKKIKQQYKQIKELANSTKINNLWHHEAVVRKKLKELSQMPPQHLKDYDRVYKDYVNLLNDISERILSHYNKKNGTDYIFEEVIKEDFSAYLSSGIMSMLMTTHIPNIVAEEFRRHFPANPKDEYTATRTMKRTFILHLGETNTGKTYNALERLKTSAKGVYLAPLRILALENFERLNNEGVRCNLLTGEEEITVDGACHTSCTIEKLNIEWNYEVAVIDEIQMIADSQRGAAWTRAVLGLRASEIHVCGALNAKKQLVRMIEDCCDSYEIHEYTRMVPLELEIEPVSMSQVRKGDALVAFSKKRVLALSQHLADRGTNTSVIYGDLPPEVRKLQYDAFISGERPVLVSTDAIGMGVNLPIRRIIFTGLDKFDGEEVRPLTSQEIKQIAGRAGRLGIYDIGYVASTTGGQLFIKDHIETPDEEIEQAVVGPSEAILDIGKLPLGEKLALWSTREESLPYYRKMDVRDFLLILDKIKRYRLSEDIQWRLMYLPFDVSNEELIELFLDYVDEHFIAHEQELTRPPLMEQDLAYLEVYYQKINLYYSFSKAFDLFCDEKWVHDTRGIVSEKINKLLC